MVKNYVYSLAFVFVLASILLANCTTRVKAVTPTPVYTTSSGRTHKPKPVTDRDVLQVVYMLEVGVREKSGRNDGREVEMYLQATGLGKGNPWCAAFVRWCFDQAGIKTTITAWSPTAHNPKDVVYYKEWKKNAQHGDVFTLYYYKIGRIGHTGFVNKVYNDNSMVETVEGNTNGEGSREGDGVYIKFRPIKTINSITSWIK